MARGPAGGHGLPVHQGGNQGQEPAIILHLKGVEQPAWAHPARLRTAERYLLKTSKSDQN